jgi:hypothetical protein
MAGTGRHLTTEEVIEALEASHGLVTLAARQLQCAPNTIRNHMKRSKAVADAVREQREHVLDLAEQSLITQVQLGEGWAVCFLLKTLGKERGFVERQEVTGKDGDGLTVKLVWPQLSDEEDVPRLPSR